MYHVSCIMYHIIDKTNKQKSCVSQTLTERKLGDMGEAGNVASCSLTNTEHHTTPTAAPYSPEVILGQWFLVS